LPTFKEQLVKEKEDNVKKENKNKKKGKENKHPRNAFFCVGYCKHWKKPLPVTMSEIKKRCDLTWLRFSVLSQISKPK